MRSSKMAEADDIITINCVESHATEVFRQLLRMQKRRLWTDFVINVNETSLPCHRTIVCANSRMIRELLEDEGMAEAAKYAINLNHLNVDTTEKVLTFMYSGKISFSGADLKEYLEVALYLKMDTLTTRCMEHVPSRLTPQNALVWFNLGSKRKLPELIEHASKVITHNFAEISSQQDFVTLQKPQLDRCLQEALAPDAAKHVSRDDVLRAVISWVTYDDGTRVAYLEDLVNTVQPETCTADALCNAIHTHPTIIGQNTAVLLSMTAAIHRFTAQETRNQMGRGERQTSTDDYGVPLKEDPVAEVEVRGEAQKGGSAAQIEEGTVTREDDLSEAQIGGVVGRKKAMAQKEDGTLVVKEKAKQEKEPMKQDDKAAGVAPMVFKLPELPTSNSEPSKSACKPRERMNRRLAIIGGHRYYNPMPFCWIIDQESNQFVQFATTPANTLGRGHSVSATGDGFVISGGIKSKICLKYAVSSKTWTRMKDMLEERYYHGSCFQKGVFCVLGGIVSGWSKTISIHSLQMECGKWKHAMDILDPVQWPKVANLDNSTYVHDEQTRHLMRIDVEKKTCLKLTSLPGEGPCEGVSMTSVNRKLCVAGGEARICAMYDPSTDDWCNIQRPRNWHSYGSLTFYQNKLFLIGGQFENQNQQIIGSDAIEEYNFDEGQWSTSEVVMPQSLVGHYSFVLDMPQQNSSPE